VTLEVDRIEAGGVGGTGRIPRRGSYRGTFKDAFRTNQWQWEASQERDREFAEWLGAMEPFQKEAKECAEKLRKATPSPQPLPHWGEAGVRGPGPT
jgi:hypothetical protein